MSDTYDAFSKDYLVENKQEENLRSIQAEFVLQPELYGLSKPRRDVVIIRIAKNEN